MLYPQDCARFDRAVPFDRSYSALKIPVAINANPPQIATYPDSRIALTETIGPIKKIL